MFLQGLFTSYSGKNNIDSLITKPVEASSLARLANDAGFNPVLAAVEYTLAFCMHGVDKSNDVVRLC